MKKLALLLGIASASVFGSAQMISAYSHSGTFSVSTRADQYVWSLGGSYRTGLYHYWRDYIRQSTNVSTAIPFVGTSSPIQAVGNYYLPAYSVTGQVSTNLVNTATEADYTVSYSDQFVWAPTLPANTAASEGSSIQDIFTFTLPFDADVTLTPVGTASYHIFVGASGSVVFYTSSGPVTATLPAGTYYVEVNATNSVASSTQTGIFQSNPGLVNFGYTMKVTAPSDTTIGD